VNVCTIVAKNYLAHARVLGLSLREQHPESRLSVLVLDDVDGFVDPDAEPYRLLTPADIDCEPFHRMAAAYSVIELSTAVKPWLLRKLLEHDDHAIYLDPDIQVTAPLDELRDLAVRHGIVLTPHNLTPIPRDGHYPSEESILIAGAYNLGFIALGATETAHDLLDWWSERLETDCVVDPGSGRFVDQKWIDLVPGIWPQTHLLRDPAYNIAYWNLHARRLEYGSNGGPPTVDGRTVRFLHFSGYDPRRPDELSKHQDRIRLEERPDVRRACDEYGAALLEQGFEDTSTWPYGLASAFRGGHDTDSEPHRIDGVNVIGYLNAELGVGEVARQAISALDAEGVPVLPVGISSGVSREGHAFERVEATAAAPFNINLVCVNADMLPTVAGDLGPEMFDGRRTVGWWWWEVDTFPERWHGSFDLVHEVWAGSRFVAETLAAVSPVPVVHIPTPVTMRPGIVADRRALGLPDGFLFLFVFDFNSVMARKNPEGVLEAFRRAFPEPRDGVSLILKTINGDSHAEAVARLEAAIAGRDDMRMMGDYLDPAAKDALIASCDCYVSLHRSEGFGITLAEAMLLGRPVIGTAYSGSADYLNEQTGFPVRHTVVPIGSDAGPYPSGGRWAEPDLDHAAELMRTVVDDPEAAAARARRGQAYIREHHSPAAAGRAMADRLSRLAPTPGTEIVDPPATVIAEQARRDTLGLIRRDDPTAVSAKGRAAQRVTTPLLRRVRSLQREIDEALWWSVESQAVASQRLVDELDRRLRHVESLVTAAALAEKRQSRELSALNSWSQAQAAIVPAIVREKEEHAKQLAAILDELPNLQTLYAAAIAEPYMHDAPFERFETAGTGTVVGFRDNEDATADDARYHAFEDLFRGSEDLVRDRQRRYVPLLEGHAPVLDLGCGRGELLDVLRDAGIEGRGVDSDPELVAYCRAKGHDQVAQADAVTHLEGQEAASLGAICSTQVIEHLDGDALTRLLTAGRRALRPGGRMILETVNPHSPWALKAFWVDLTHQQLIFPEVLLQLCRAAGFGEAYIFAPQGEGDWDADRTRQGEYAVVATRR
jgi:glycosyltransferase involved in cell wall biosynthesis/SAM-dependent methyltransferase